jgi:hypothetical protein
MKKMPWGHPQKGAPPIYQRGVKLRRDGPPVFVEKVPATQTVQIDVEAELDPEAFRRLVKMQLLRDYYSFGSVTGRWFSGHGKAEIQEIMKPPPLFPKNVDLLGIYRGDIPQYQGQKFHIQTPLAGPLGVTEKCLCQARQPGGRWMSFRLMDFELQEWPA